MKQQQAASGTMLDLALVGIALGTTVVLVIVLCLYYRLKSEHEALEKVCASGRTSLLSVTSSE